MRMTVKQIKKRIDYLNKWLIGYTLSYKGYTGDNHRLQVNNSKDQPVQTYYGTLRELDAYIDGFDLGTRLDPAIKEVP